MMLTARRSRSEYVWFEIATLDLPPNTNSSCKDKEARHAAVPVVALPGWDLPAPAAASPLGGTDLPHVSRRADGELSGDACAGVSAVQRLAGSLERPVRPSETATDRLHALAGARRLRSGVHSGCGAGQARFFRGPRSVANEKSRAFARAAGRGGGVGAGHGLALPILVPSAMGDGARIERSPDASVGTNVGAASAERGCVHTVRLRRRGTAAVVGSAYVAARHRSGGCALVGDIRSTDGGDVVAGGARAAVD